MCVVYVWCKLCPEVLNPGKTMMIMQFLNVVCFICFCTRVCVCVCNCVLCEEDMQGNDDHAVLKCCVFHMFLHVCVCVCNCVIM